MWFCIEMCNYFILSFSIHEKHTMWAGCMVSHVTGRLLFVKRVKWPILQKNKICHIGAFC